MTKWIVECSICRRPFVHESDVMPWADADRFIKVPDHPIPGTKLTRCLGCDVTGFYIARKDAYKPRGKAQELLKQYPELMPE